MSKKKFKKLQEMQEEAAKKEIEKTIAERPMTLEEIANAFKKAKKKRPMLHSSHGGKRK